MIVTATGSGGYCGSNECLSLDTTNLENGKAIERLVAKVDWGTARPTCIGADLQRWEIIVEDGKAVRCARFTDDGSTASAPWQLLLAELRAAQA